MEKDDEIKGSGNSYTTEWRQYDPRLARWMSLDPLMAKYPHQSPYAAFNNNPIYFADPTGLEGEETTGQDPTKDPKPKGQYDSRIVAEAAAQAEVIGAFAQAAEEIGVENTNYGYDVGRLLERIDINVTVEEKTIMVADNENSPLLKEKTVYEIAHIEVEIFENDNPMRINENSEIYKDAVRPKIVGESLKFGINFALKKATGIVFTGNPIASVISPAEMGGNGYINPQHMRVLNTDYILDQVLISLQPQALD